MLIIFGGLPGTGKTTIAKQLAQTIQAVYLRIDTIEQVLQHSKLISADCLGPEGYLIAYELAKDNLALGLKVVADSVNPIDITRNDWLTVAQHVGVPSLAIEVICSNQTEHRRRVEERTADIEHHVLPTWQEVMDKDYQPWDNVDLQLDTAVLSVEENVKKIIDLLPY
ncbi:AAA family ATPase [Legionella worsleiensis]|uniref:Adenylyl-sulfate kinase n=1 Tax=Legionella worsleiensis TaxID=45076 RepID=A0A0W1AHB0_9GAMM|nr:AAA family ATPase [Legionella worsleiensis]KTD80706.1 Adenylyl-sulfate kinase [Legionella worsleiensis]STY32716.1 L-seryl-tRNA(Sec) kinase [Legionella worsleiensis]